MKSDPKQAPVTANYTEENVYCALFLKIATNKTTSFGAEKKKKPQNKVTDRTEVEINREESPRMD